MKAYIAKLQQEKTPHERRSFATKVAGIVTALFFIVWVSTLGIRFAAHSGETAQNIQNTAAGLYAVEELPSTTENR